MKHRIAIAVAALLFFAFVVRSPEAAQIISVKATLQSGVPVLETPTIQPGNPPLERANRAQTDEQAPFFMEVLDASGTVLFSKGFDFIRALDVPPQAPGLSEDDAPRHLDLPEPEIVLILPYFEDAVQVRIVARNSPVAQSVATLPEPSAQMPSAPEVQPTPAEQGKLHVLIMASGFSNLTTFQTKATAAKNYLLSKQPYASNASKVAIHVYSNTTDLGCAANCYNIDRLLCCDSQKILNAAAVSGYLYDEIIVIHDTDTYCGGGARDLGNYQQSSASTMCQVYSGSWSIPMILHEFGHSFGNLCDEYTYGTEGYSYYDCVNCQPSCSIWSGLTSGCNLSCDAKPSYYRPDPSIMLDYDYEYYNTPSIQNSLLPRLKYFTNTASCTYSISSLSNYASSGGSQTLNISASTTSCAWTASANGLSWVHLSKTSGTGSGSLTVTVDSNSTTSSRSGTITVAGKTITVTQSGLSCSYTVSSLGSFSSDGGSQTLSIGASASSCAWTASANSLSWVHLSKTSGTGSGSLTVTADRNNTTVARSGTITVAGKALTVSQAAAASCTYTLSSLSVFSSTAGSQSMSVTASTSSCSWTASVNSLSWVHLSATSGTGSAALTISVDKNTATTMRSGTITVAGKSVTISQSGAACSFTVSALNNFASAASSQTVNITTSNSSCTWTASESLDWVSLSSSGGTGNGSVTVSVTQNNTVFSRSGSITIAGQTITVTQAAAESCSFTLSALREFYNTANSQAVNVTTSGPTCTWAASGNLDWVSFYPTSGTGSGTVVVSVKKNTSTSPRTGVVTIAGQSVTITQAAYSPRSVTLPDTGQTKCYNNLTEITCPARGANFYGQDGNFRGVRQSYKGNGDTVTDLVTGLIWQQADDGVKRNWVDAVSYCQNMNLGNQVDWRLPTIYELQIIADSGTSEPAINHVFNCSNNKYWSSTTRYKINSEDSAWCETFDEGYIAYMDKSDTLYVRCVRGSPSPESVYIDNGNGTVVDQTTGLVWEKAGSADRMSWKAALAWCELTTTGGYSDWRLPNMHELQNLLDHSRYPQADPVFTESGSGYWAGTTYAGYADSAGTVYFDAGGSVYIYKSFPHNVRCVRGGHGFTGSASLNAINLLLQN